MKFILLINIQIEEEEGLYYLYSKNKGAEQLHDHCAVTVQLICTYVFAYAKSRFSQEAAIIISMSIVHH